MDVGKDQVYLNGLFKKDGKILQEIYQKFRPRVVAFVQKNGGSREDAHDLFQVCLEIVYFKQHDKNFHLHGSFYGFLLAVCRNKWLDELKKRRPSVELSSAGESIGINSDADEAQRDWAQFQLYEEKFKELSENCQQFLGLFYKENLSHEKIAERMGCSEKYSRLCKHRCLEKLKKLIAEDPRFRELSNSKKN